MKRIITGRKKLYERQGERSITLSFGKVDGYGNGRKSCLMEVEICLKDSDKGPAFSVMGNVWNSSGTDIILGGQCLDTLAEFAKSFRQPLRTAFRKIHGLWKEYHLNDMKAGTPEQERCLESAPVKVMDYDVACDYLKANGLYEVELDGKPYRYGESWLYEPIPPSVLSAIRKVLAIKTEAPKEVPRDISNDVMEALEGVL